MNMLANIFLTVLGMSLTAAYCILAVCLLRTLLRSMPKIFSYCLWFVVALRLICPILPESRFSLMGNRVVESARRIASSNVEYELGSGTGVMADGFGGDMVPDASGIHGWSEVEGVGITTPSNGKETGEKGGDTARGTAASRITAGDNPQAGEIVSGSVTALGSEVANTDSSNIIHFAAAIWLGIFLILCAYGIGSYFRLKTRLAKVAYAGGTFENIPVKYAPGIETPFVLGLTHPVVYLPDTLTDGEAMQCLSHERVHVRRRDYLVKQFAFVLACVHWFNPFVWLAFHLMSQDMEMSCDEQALQSPALADRKTYSDTLLKVSTGRMQFGGCPLAFGEKSASLRIKNIMNYKKPSFWAVVVVCVVIVACMAGLFTNPVDGTEDETEQHLEATGEPPDNMASGTESQNSTLANMEKDSLPEASLPEHRERSIGLVQAQYEAELVDVLQKNLENNYLKQIGTLEASIRTIEDILTEQNIKLTKLQNNLNTAPQNSAGEEQAEEIAYLMNTEKELSAKKAALEIRLQQMDIADMDGQDITLDYSANKYLNQPEINCFLMQNFSTSQIDLDFLLYDGAGMENSEPGAEELQLLKDMQADMENSEQQEIFYHFTGEQVDSFLTETLGLPLSEIQYGTGSGNTLKDTWNYLEEYDSYTLFAPKGDTFYTKVECWNAFNYYNGILRLDYKNADKKASKWSACPLVEGSLYLAPKDAKNGDVNHLNSYYIIGNVIHKGALKDRDSANAFDLSEYLNRLKQ